VRILYKYFLSQAGVVYGHAPSLWKKVKLIDAPEPTIHGFNKYILSAIQSDFPAHHPKDCDAVLHDIDRLERGEIEKCFAGTVDTFMHTLTPTQVTFEHSIFGECPEWPLWSCTLAQYKAALQGWRKFIDMPKSIDTELIVDLPDDTLQTP
jgi:hypothetical protein